MQTRRKQQRRGFIVRWLTIGLGSLRMTTTYGAAFANGTIGLMALPASLLSGVLWQVISPSAPFVVGAALALTASVLLALRWRSTFETRRMDRV